MHFYIHIPFCRQKCTYCKFALTPVFDEYKKKRYLFYLKQEIENYLASSSLNNDQGAPSTLYFGGGTPSILSLEEIYDILGYFHEYKNMSEISFEANPEDITEEYMRGLFGIGITRISLGVQTLNDDSLREIQRSDARNIFQAMENISIAREEYRDVNISVNVDFILGLPYVQEGETLHSIEYIHKTFPCITHTSVYMLEDERYPVSWKNHTLNTERIKQEFVYLMEYMEKYGWNHYETSNFSKPGYESLHNQSYWNHSNYRGFGLSAASFIDGKRFMNSPSFSGYYAGKKVDEEILTPEQTEIETIMFGLRTTGISGEKNKKKIQKLIDEGLLEVRSEVVFPTKTGIFLLDYIISELI